ncbi:hypothetical protein [Ralstonia phage RP31]|uniref:Uncharacterized protein n=2 Tax=Ripduovirus RP12 TaxID=2560700 RepID=A0A1L7N0S1_9CAUD|nr:hypothetical protein FDH28_gp095 [Ralstonia phage RP12]BAW19069.1 hypothetical protein [Ralstonia phage RP12]BAW19354.1 hypothetical protein [Ralstonia phage RP31]
MQEKQFAFIPWWIIPVLKRNSLKTEDLLSFERIRPFFSTEDLTSLAALGYQAQLFAGNGVGSDTISWTARWLASASDARVQQAITDIAALAASELTQEETLRRLVVEPSSAVSVSAGYVPPAETFEVSLMGDLAIAVVLKQGFTLAEHVKNSINLLRCMAKQLYVYEDYHELVSRPVGQAYIESLMH